MPPSSQSLAAVAEANSYIGIASLSQMLRLAMLSNIVKIQNPMANTSAQSLIAQASCYLCLGITAAEAMELVLLSMIAGGAAPATTCMSSGNGPPAGNPGCTVAIYFDESAPPNLGFWAWTGTWNQVIGAGP